MWPNPQETVDLVTFTKEILNGKPHFLCSEKIVKCQGQGIASKIRKKQSSFGNLKWHEIQKAVHLSIKYVQQKTLWSKKVVLQRNSKNLN